LPRASPRSARDWRWRRDSCRAARDDDRSRTEKADPRPAILQDTPASNTPWGEGPGGTERSTRAKIHFFLAFLAFFALAFFAFFAFLAIVSSQGLMDGNATPRHAWRRASLATSSITIPPDSLADAAPRHGVVIALSTVVMHFYGLIHRNAGSSTPSASRASCLTRPERARSSSFQNHGADYLGVGDGPLIRTDAPCLSRQRGLSRGNVEAGALSDSVRQQGRRGARVPGSRC